MRLSDTRLTERQRKFTLPGPFWQRALDGKFVAGFERVDIL